MAYQKYLYATNGETDSNALSSMTFVTDFAGAIPFCGLNAAASDPTEVFSAMRAGGPAAWQAPARPQFAAPPQAATLPTVPSTLTVAADMQTVVILDTGISSTISNLIYEYDFVGNDSNASTTVSHGSIVASQVLAADGEANIVVLKVADDAGNISTSAVDSALDWVAKYASQLNIAAVNLSFGASSVVSSETATSLSDEFATLSQLDVAVVAAAGNSSSKSGVSALSSDANVICVSASDGDCVFSSYSNRDADLTDLVADGTNITYGSSTVSGTSFSAPLVAGAIANLKDAFYTTYGYELTAKQALLILQATGDAMSSSGEVAGTSSSAGDGYVQLDLEASLAVIHDVAELALIGINVAVSA